MNKEEKAPGLKKAWLIFLIILGFVIGFFLPRPIIIWPWNYISLNEAIQKISEFLHEEMAEEDVAIELLSIEEEHNLYKLKLKIGEQYFLSYLTKDGKLLFPSVINLDPPTERTLTQSDNPSIDLFVTALSPVASMAERNIFKAIEPFEGKIDFNIHYIVLPELGEEKCLDEDQKYCSERGLSELNQTMRELCVAKHHPEKLSEFISLVNDWMEEHNSEEDVLEYEETEANEIMVNMGIDKELINQCISTEGQDFLEEQITLRQNKYPVRSPEYYIDSFGEYQTESVISRVDLALVINGMIYGQAEELYYLDSDDYKEIICQSFSENRKPEICLNLENNSEEELLEEEPTETPLDSNL